MTRRRLSSKEHDPDAVVGIVNVDGTVDVHVPDSLIEELQMPEPTDAEKKALMQAIVGIDVYNHFTKE